MIAHTLFPAKKRVFFDYLKVHDRIDRILAYSTSEERHMIDRLGVPATRCSASTTTPTSSSSARTDSPPEPDLICAAGQLLARLRLPDRRRSRPAGARADRRRKPLDRLDASSRKRRAAENVNWGRFDRYELRDLYARSAIAVVPILQNEYQTGIATILEMMSMGKCVIATRTRGQTDTIVDGVTGVYVPPGDPAALAERIERMIEEPRRGARSIGQNARRFIEEEAGLDRFVERIVGRGPSGACGARRVLRLPAREASSSPMRVAWRVLVAARLADLAALFVFRALRPVLGRRPAPRRPVAGPRVRERPSKSRRSSTTAASARAGRTEAGGRTSSATEGPARIRFPGIRRHHPASCASSPPRFGALVFRFRAPPEFERLPRGRAEVPAVRREDVARRPDRATTSWSTLDDGWKEALVPWSLLNPTEHALRSHRHQGAASGRVRTGCSSTRSSSPSRPTPTRRRASARCGRAG